MILIFQFSIYKESGEAVWTGNISPTEALQYLQTLVIQDAVDKAQQEALSRKEEDGTVCNPS